LAPGDSKVLVIQWALRDPELAFEGEGPKTSNYSLQANDYINQGLDFNYFEKLANIYFDKRNELGQITVGLETGIESVGFIDEYKKQIAWIKNKGITDVTMSEMRGEYGKRYGEKNSDEVRIGEWKMSPDFRENKKLGERIEYQKDLAFEDYFERDSETFLNRIYSRKNLVSGKRISLVALGIIFILGVGILGGINLLPLGAGWLGIKIIEQLRYSVVEGERMAGFLIDNFRFVGVTDKFRFINEDLSNLVAQTMLKIEIREICYLWGIIIWLIIGVAYGKYLKTRQNRKSIK
jgi:hypothetical protein